MPPVATISNQTLHINEWSQIGNLLTYSDADGHPATQYQFWDGGTAANSGYFWTPTNSHWAAGTAIDVSAADLDNVWLRGGAGTGTETMYVRAFRWDRLECVAFVRAHDHRLECLTAKWKMG